MLCNSAKASWIVYKVEKNTNKCGKRLLVSGFYLFNYLFILAIFNETAQKDLIHGENQNGGSIIISKREFHSNITVPRKTVAIK